MTISSWNVNSVRARIENIKEYIKKFSPDVLMMQEINNLLINLEILPQEYLMITTSSKVKVQNSIKPMILKIKLIHHQHKLKVKQVNLILEKKVTDLLKLLQILCSLNQLVKLETLTREFIGEKTSLL